MVVTSEETPLPQGLSDRSALVIDPQEQSWGCYVPDSVTLRTLVHELPLVTDGALRAATWNNIKSGYHLGMVDPDLVVDLLEAALPVHDTEDTGRRTMPWVLGQVLPAASAGARDRVHAAAVGLITSSEAGSELQLSAFRASISTASDVAVVRRWLDQAPDGIDDDLNVRWRLLVQLAALGGTDRAELAAALADERTAQTRVEHTRAVASLPTDEAKAFAWERFTGEVDVANYELVAAGHGLWRGGQEQVTASYVERYFTDLPATANVRSGWVLALAAESFFPRCFVDDTTLVLAQQLAASGLLEPAVRRRVVDEIDLLQHKLAVRAAFPRP